MADTGSQEVLAPSMGTTQRHVVHQQVAGESDLQQGAEAENCSRVDHNVAYIGDVAETEAWFEMALDLSVDKKTFWGEVGLAHQAAGAHTLLAVISHTLEMGAPRGAVICSVVAVPARCSWLGHVSHAW